MERVEQGWYVDWDDVRELRRMIELDGVPEDPDDLCHKFVQMVRRSEGLYVLFGRQWDEASRRECFAMLQSIKQLQKWKRQATHVAPATVH